MKALDYEAVKLETKSLSNEDRSDIKQDAIKTAILKWNIKTIIDQFV